jgi:hypothetical protein
MSTPTEAQERLEQALFEIRRVIAGQDAMLERVLVCLLAQGHLLIEGVPGLAKTLTISSRPISFRPTSSAPASTGRERGSSTPSSGPSSATSCSPTRSTARRRRFSPRCSR